MSERELVAKWRQQEIDCEHHADDAEVRGAGLAYGKCADELEALLNSRVGGETGLRQQVVSLRAALDAIALGLTGDHDASRIYARNVLKDTADHALALRGGEPTVVYQQSGSHLAPSSAAGPSERALVAKMTTTAAPSPGGVDSEMPLPWSVESTGDIVCVRISDADGNTVADSLYRKDAELIVRAVSTLRPTPPEVTESMARSIKDDISRAFIKDPSSLDNIETWRAALAAALAGGK